MMNRRQGLVLSNKELIKMLIHFDDSFRVMLLFNGEVGGHLEKPCLCAHRLLCRSFMNNIL